MATGDPLQPQIEAVRYLVEQALDLPEEVKASLHEAVTTLQNKQDRENKRRQSAIWVLPDDASAAEVWNARRVSAVRLRGRTYLPSVGDAGEVVLPVALLRSSLFAVVRTPSIEPYSNEKLGSQSQFSVWQSGLQLKDRDLHVYAACLQQYNKERPLGEPVDLSYFQLSEVMGVPYGLNVHRAIAASLVRLGAARVHLRAAMKTYPERHLLMLDAEHEVEKGTPRGSDRVHFTVPEAVAEWFGKNLWSTVSLAALGETEGLSRWLVGFYATHGKAHGISVHELKRMSGAQGPPSAFRRRLAEALQSLMQGTMPMSARVTEFSFDVDDRVTVHLARWEHKMK